MSALVGDTESITQKRPSPERTHSSPDVISLKKTPSPVASAGTEKKKLGEGEASANSKAKTDISASKIDNDKSSGENSKTGSSETSTKATMNR